MGNSLSPSANTNSRFLTACRAFSPKELDDLKSLFSSLAPQSSSQSNALFLSPSLFKKYIGVEGRLGDRMFDLVTSTRGNQKLTFEDLVIAKATYEKGAKNEIEEFIYQLVDVNGDGILGRCDLEIVLSEMLYAVFSQKGSEPQGGIHQEIIGLFLNGAKFSQFSQIGGVTEKSMSIEDFRRWCTLLPAVSKFLGSLLMPADSGRPGLQVPRLLHQENVDSSLVLLRKEYAWQLGGALPQQELDEWKLLYHSAIHGLSFNTFLGNISKDQGPSLLLIKDTEGYIYGGYASQPWERHADFYGDLKSFLFQLYPAASVFRPTGANNNVQWCAVNFSSESIPNGLGFGGRVNYFGLFVSANFDQGRTFASTTFGNPCLSKTNQIFPEVIECWRIGLKKNQQERQDSVKGTVLERFKEDRHMLNMVGLANSSE